MIKRIVLALSLLATPALADWSLQDMNRTIDQTNFIVNEGCSGTLIDLEKKLVLTASHCVTGQYGTVEREKIDSEGKVTSEKVRKYEPGTVRQLSYQGSTVNKEVAYTTVLRAVDTSKDLALLEIQADIPNTQVAKMYCGQLQRGETVYVVGNPMGVLYSSVVKGVISSVRRTYRNIGYDYSDEPIVQISAGIVGGNSGGAVYNSDGEFVGVPLLGHRTNEVLGFAATIQSVVSFLKSNKVNVCGS